MLILLSIKRWKSKTPPRTVLIIALSYEYYAFWFVLLNGPEMRDAPMAPFNYILYWAYISKAMWYGCGRQIEQHVTSSRLENTSWVFLCNTDVTFPPMTGHTDSHQCKLCRKCNRENITKISYYKPCHKCTAKLIPGRSHDLVLFPRQTLLSQFLVGRAPGFRVLRVHLLTTWRVFAIWPPFSLRLRH